MQTFTANEAKTRFGEFLDRAQRAPVGVLKHDRMVGVMVSVQDFEAMRAFYADRLQHRIDETQLFNQVPLDAFGKIAKLKWFAVAIEPRSMVLQAHEFEGRSFHKLASGVA